MHEQIGRKYDNELLFVYQFTANSHCVDRVERRYLRLPFSNSTIRSQQIVQETTYFENILTTR